MFDGVKMLDVIAPAEVFVEANRAGASYDLQFVSVDGAPVRTSVGATLSVAGAASAISSSDTIIISGLDDLERLPLDPRIIEATRHLATGATRIASVCTGAFYLAKAGLLNGKRATTHSRAIGYLRRSFPDVEVVPDVVFVEDDAVFTSAGMAAGTDLALSFVQRDYGPATARIVAEAMMTPMQRTGTHSQHPIPLPQGEPLDMALQKVLQLIAQDPTAPHTVASLAHAAAISPRQLHRLFVARLGITPSEQLRKARLDIARAFLDSGGQISEAARASGLGSTSSLRRSFRREFGETPLQYRKKRMRYNPSHPTQ